MRRDVAYYRTKDDYGCCEREDVFCALPRDGFVLEEGESRGRECTEGVVMDVGDIGLGIKWGTGNV